METAVDQNATGMVFLQKVEKGAASLQYLGPGVRISGGFIKVWQRKISISGSCETLLAQQKEIRLRPVRSDPPTSKHVSTNE